MNKIIITLSILAIGTTISAQTLSLDSCKTYALENNKRLKEARLHQKAAEQVKKEAFTKYFPNVSAGAMAMKANEGLLQGEVPEMNLPILDYSNPAGPVQTPLATYFPGMGINILDYTNVAYVMALQPVFMGGRIINGNKLAKLGVEVQDLMIEMTTDEVLLNTETYYWTIVSLQEKSKTLESYQKLLLNLKKDVEVAYAAGLVHKSDLLRVEMELNNIKANKLKLENGISILKMTLAQNIGIKNTNFSIIDSAVNIKEPVSLYSNPDEALMNRTEYHVLNKSIQAEELKKKMAFGEHLPQVAVGAQAFYIDMMEHKTNNALGVATISIPISDWWGGSHKVKEHQIKIDIAKNNLDEKSELLKLQMDKTYNDLNESYLQITVAESSVKQASEHFAVVNDNFKAGIIGTSDLLEAQAMLQESNDKVVDAKTDYKVKQALYLQAISQLQ